MQLGRLRHQLLVAMGLPACWTASPERTTPPPPDQDGSAHHDRDTRHDDTQEVATDTWAANPAAGQTGCTPETVCGRSDTKHGPTGCGPHGDSLESFGGNYQKMSVTKMSWGANPGELRLFDLDPGETARYQHTVTVTQNLDRYCCYSHCTPSRAASKIPVTPAGMQMNVSCTAAQPGVAHPHRDNPDCDATSGKNPYVNGTDAQCCYASFEPIPPPQEPRHYRGRAARVEGDVVVAPVHGGASWNASDVRPTVRGLASETRLSLREAWQVAAQMEHASIAAFSALSLRLIALGAPAELIARTHAAALDEVRHAQIAFALASAYADAPLQPARFDEVARLATTSTLAALARETFLDGCIEETAAAVDAALAATTAEDPVVADALRSIADDESRHAELAWAIVAWCVRSEPAIADELRALLADQLVTAPPIAAPDPLASHGIRSSTESARAKASVLREVVEPCFTALRAAVSSDASSGIA